MFINYVIDSICFCQIFTVCYKSEEQGRVKNSMSGKVFTQSTIMNSKYFKEFKANDETIKQPRRIYTWVNIYFMMGQRKALKPHLTVQGASAS